MEIFGTLVTSFLKIDNDLDQFDFLAMLSLRSAELTSEEKTDETRIAACDSNLWCVLEVQGKHLEMRADSDSLFVKGLALLLKDETECRSLEQLAKAPLVLSQYLYEHKAMDEKRRDGMAEMEERIYRLAIRAAEKG